MIVPSGQNVVSVDRREWPRPGNVRACFTTRHGGFNLGLNTGEPEAVVCARRRRLQRQLGLDLEPAWLRQVHGTQVVEAAPDMRAEADAAWSSVVGQACVVLTADCLPVLFCDDAGSAVAAAHAGWRGLCAGVLESTLAAMRHPPERLSAWIGPAIGLSAFEVGPEVREAFLRRNPAYASAFIRGRGDRWMGDLRRMAEQALHTVGLTRVFGVPRCTYRDADQFFSFRREPADGRMAALIWLAAESAIACP